MSPHEGKTGGHTNHIRLARNRTTARIRRERKKEIANRLTKCVRSLSLQLKMLQSVYETLTPEQRGVVHKIMLSLGEPPLACRYCDKTFDGMIALKAHVTANHQNEINNRIIKANPKATCPKPGSNGSGSGGENEEPMSLEERQRRRLQRNAASARLCRQRKKLYIENLRLQVPVLQHEIMSLLVALPVQVRPQLASIGFVFPTAGGYPNFGDGSLEASSMASLAAGMSMNMNMNNMNINLNVDAITAGAQQIHEAAMNAAPNHVSTPVQPNLGPGPGNFLKNIPQLHQGSQMPVANQGQNLMFNQLPHMPYGSLQSSINQQIPNNNGLNFQPGMVYPQMNNFCFGNGGASHNNIGASVYIPPQQPQMVFQNQPWPQQTMNMSTIPVNLNLYAGTQHDSKRLKTLSIDSKIQTNAVNQIHLNLATQLQQGKQNVRTDTESKVKAPDVINAAMALADFDQTSTK